MPSRRVSEGSLILYSTCPPYRDGGAQTYHRQVCAVARWNEEAGCDGILVYTDNGLLDPWLVSQLNIQSSSRLSPLVAVRPVYDQDRLTEGSALQAVRHPVHKTFRGL